MPSLIPTMHLAINRGNISRTARVQLHGRKVKPANDVGFACHIHKYSTLSTYQILVRERKERTLSHMAVIRV